MIRIAVFDNDSSNREAIKSKIIKFTVQSLTDFDVLWFFEKIDERKIAKYASTIHIALISLDLQDGKKIGETLYRFNEDCRIIFYSQGLWELEELLYVRPRGFYNIKSGEDSLFRCINDIVPELKISKNIFYYETRKELLIIPLRSILYFQSDLKYVIIHTKNGRDEKIYTKLSEIEPELNSDFVRIHKSYIVNTYHICGIDKSQKTVTLKNNELLPISEANYKDTINYFSGRKTT